MHSIGWRSIRGIPVAALALSLWMGTATAQTYYGGYDIGPDFDAMLNQMFQQQQMLGQQMQNTHANVIQQVMRDPRAQAMYQQHLASGGRMSFPEFAYAYAATGGFTPEGMRQYQQNEAANRSREHQAWQGAQQAGRNRAMAQGNHAESYFHNQQEAGNIMQGRSSWINPHDGRTYALPYIGPSPVYDPQTGNYFGRDNLGNQWVGTPDGYWTLMTPAR